MVLEGFTPNQSQPLEADWAGRWWGAGVAALGAAHGAAGSSVLFGTQLSTKSAVAAAAWGCAGHFPGAKNQTPAEERGILLSIRLYCKTPLAVFFFSYHNNKVELLEWFQHWLQLPHF